MPNFYMIGNWILFILILRSVWRRSKVENKKRNTLIAVIAYPLIFYLVALVLVGFSAGFELLDLEDYLYFFWLLPYIGY